MLAYYTISSIELFPEIINNKKKKKLFEKEKGKLFDLTLQNKSIESR